MEQAETEVLNAEEVATEEPTEEVEQVEQPAETTEESSEEPADEGVVVTIGEESPPQEEERAPEWVRELRKSNRETVRENRELKKQLEQLKTTPAKQETLGEKPTLEACEYDTEAYETKLASWYEQKREHDEQERRKQEEGAKAQQAWNARLTAYQEQRSALKVSDFEDAEETVKDLFSPDQQGLLIKATKNPAVAVYALGKNPKKAQELASIKDPIDFAIAVHDLETQMKVTPRKTAPVPETTVRGNARVSAGIDSTLERLRAEADRTGDRTKVAAYMREQNRARTK